MSITSALLTAKQLSISIGGRQLFHDVSMSIHANSRIALVGPNGVGKSTLLKVLSGELPKDDGMISTRRGVLVEYVPQFLPPGEIRTSLYDFLAKHIHLREKQRPGVEEWQALEMLETMRFSPDDIHNKPCGVLSGGEVNRLLLARALVVKPDILLLDEPTNHLDTEAIIRFEKFVSSAVGIPFCLVSHDRTLIDTVTNETIFLREGTAHHFRLPLSEARDELAHRDEVRAQQRQFQLDEIARLEKSAKDLQAWAKRNPKFSGRFHSMEKRIERMKGNITTTAKADRRVLGVRSSIVDANSLVALNNFSVVVGDKNLLYTVPRFEIAPGDKVAILGRNGAGKTSLLNAIVYARTQERNAKEISFNPRTTIGYYDQELRSLDPKKTISDNISDKTDATEDKIRQELIKAGFPYIRHGSLVETLSGGEKSRLQFLILKLNAPSLYLLDEPTNHIDLLGMEQLEEQLTEDETLTCIFVSHDRRFVESVANRFFLIKDGVLSEVHDLSEYYTMVTEPAEEQGAKLPQKPKKAAKEATVASQPPEECSLEMQITMLETRLADPALTGTDADTLRRQLDALYERFAE